MVMFGKRVPVFACAVGVYFNIIKVRYNGID
jgi:hypothetical protein